MSGISALASSYCIPTCIPKALACAEQAVMTRPLWVANAHVRRSCSGVARFKFNWVGLLLYMVAPLVVLAATKITESVCFSAERVWVSATG